MKAKCPKCQQQVELGARVGWKVGATLLGGAIGKNASSGLGGMLIGGLLGAAIGHFFDAAVLPNCASCQVALQLVEQIV